MLRGHIALAEAVGGEHGCLHNLLARRVHFHAQGPLPDTLQGRLDHLALFRQFSPGLFVGDVLFNLLRQLVILGQQPQQKMLRADVTDPLFGGFTSRRVQDPLASLGKSSKYGHRFSFAVICPFLLPYSRGASRFLTCSRTYCALRADRLLSPLGFSP